MVLYNDFNFAETFAEKIEELPGSTCITQAEIKKVKEHKPFELVDGTRLTPPATNEFLRAYELWENSHYLSTLPHGGGWMHETPEVVDIIREMEKAHIVLRDFLEARAYKKAWADSEAGRNHG